MIGLRSLQVVATVSVGPNPRRGACNEATHRVYVVNATTPGTLTVFDAAVNAVVATVAVGADPRTVGANLLIDEVYLSNYGSGSLSVVDTEWPKASARPPPSRSRLKQSTISMALHEFVAAWRASPRFPRSRPPRGTRHASEHR